MLSPLPTLATAASVTLLLLSASTLTTAALSPSDIPADTSASVLLDLAHSHFARGDVSDALAYYDAAVAREPTNYLTLFKRGATYLSLQRLPQAADDFGRVLDLRPGLESAHAQLAAIRARTADWAAAREHYRLAGKAAGPDADEQAAAAVQAQASVAAAEAAAASSRWVECVDQAGLAIRVADRAAHLRDLRARCLLGMGETRAAIVDLHAALTLRPGDTTPHVRISAVAFYVLDEAQEGLAAARKCLQSDPDSKVCRRLLKDEKAVDKALQRVREAMGAEPKKKYADVLKILVGDGLIAEVKRQVDALKQDGMIPASAESTLVATLVEMVCQAYSESSNSNKRKEYCSEALRLNPDSFHGLLDRAKTQKAAEDFEGAIASLRRASEVRPDQASHVKPLLADAEEALRASKAKDYYKVLDVSRDADAREIKAAYRRMSKQYHPDKAARGGVAKEAAEKKMASINEAWEVLSDPELKARFDRGDDPNSQEPQMRNPFQGFGHGGGFGAQQFVFQQGGRGGGGGGGQQFKFHFGM